MFHNVLNVWGVYTNILYTCILISCILVVYYIGHITASDLDTDPFLGLQDDEPDSWTPTVGKEVGSTIKE